MTIQGAIVELQNLIDVDDVPFYYKVAIKKVIETIQMEMADRKTEPTVDKDINVRSKTMRDCYNCERYENDCECIECHYEPKTEPQTCSTCRFDHKNWFEPECDSCCDSNSNWQPKDEPQTDCPFDDAIPCEWVCTEYGNCKYKPKDEPQTERSNE